MRKLYIERKENLRLNETGDDVQRGKDGPFPAFRDAGCQPPGTRSDLIRASAPRQGGHSLELGGQGAARCRSSLSGSAYIYCIFH